MTADEKTCPRCAETIKSAAVVCRFCGHEFGSDSDVPAPATADGKASGSSSAQFQPAHRGNIVGKIAGFGCLGILLLGVLASLIGGASTDNGTATNSVDLTSSDNSAIANADAALNAATEVTDTTAATPAPPATAWSYDTEHDDVRGGTRYFASVTSENQADFDFPYSGGSTLTITVRKHPQYGQDVYFVISKGQFVCGVEDCKGTINYGDGPRSLSLTEPDDNSSDTLFAANGPAVIANLKKAKRVIVELPFYQEGNRQFTFDTHGLTWPPR